jgi:hypothetical protein
VLLVPSVQQGKVVINPLEHRFCILRFACGRSLTMRIHMEKFNLLHFVTQAKFHSDAVR